MRLEPSPHVKRVKANALPKVVGFLRVLRAPPPPQGKLTGWVTQKGPTVTGICCCGDPALVGKAK
jgi:hypothetical protein